MAGSSLFIDFLRQYKEQKDEGITFHYSVSQAFKHSLIGGVIGGFLGYAHYSFEAREEEKLQFKSDAYLKQILTQENLKSNPKLLNRVLKEINQLKKLIASEFKEKMTYSPEVTGSFHKRTAIISSFDLDIVLPFKRNSYNSLAGMYFDVYYFIDNIYRKRGIVSQQTKGVGIDIKIDNYTTLHFDVIPGREIGNFRSDKDLNLFVRQSWILGKESSFKTNIAVQKRITVNNPNARNIIKLLKTYKERNNLNLPSLIIEQCVVECLSKKESSTCSSMTENLLDCMYLISKRLVRKNLADLANSNNNLLYKMSGFDKNYISNILIEDFGKICVNPHYIKEVF